MPRKLLIICLFALVTFSFLTATRISAQEFDYDKLKQNVKSFSVIIEMDIEFSFGVHNTATQTRYLGTVVSEEGLVIFNGNAFGGGQTLPVLAGVNIKATPNNIKIKTFDGKKYAAEYVGVDQSSNIGFLKIINPEGVKFNYLKFENNKDFKVGSWVALYMLLPDYITPPLATDIGFVSNIIESPEFFPMLMGFSSFQLTSVVFDENLEPLGVLGRFSRDADIDPMATIDNSDRFNIPLLGVVTAEKLIKLIASPPKKGSTEKGWLGISMQALTEDIAEYWNLELTGGIIVNDVMSQTPAFKAGLMVGDIIYEINGDQVAVNRDENMIIFQRVITDLGPNTSIELSIVRLKDNIPDYLKILVTLDAAPISPNDALEYESKNLEFTVRELVFIDYLARNLDSETFKGVLVSELQSGGLAEIEGLKIGDIIQRIGNNDVISVENFEGYIEEIETQKPSEIIFFVWRNNLTLFVNVKTDWAQAN